MARELPANLADRLSQEQQQLLRLIGRIAPAEGLAAYLVGGPVRDLLLGLPAIDYDIVVVDTTISECPAEPQEGTRQGEAAAETPGVTAEAKPAAEGGIGVTTKSAQAARPAGAGKQEAQQSAPGPAGGRSPAGGPAQAGADSGPLEAGDRDSHLEGARGAGEQKTLSTGSSESRRAGTESSSGPGPAEGGDYPAARLARRLAAEMGGRAVLHPPFLTARVDLPDGRHIDIATGRRERYPRPGALPEVEPAASIEEDLRRRDFTVNAMAMELRADRFGQIVDPLGGRADLQARILRVLHDRGFIDDPTRIVRAACYAERFGLAVEQRTMRLIREAISAGAMQTAAPQRHGEQLRRGLCTDAAGRILLRLADWGALGALGMGAELSCPRRALVDLEAGRRALGISGPEAGAAAFALAAGEQAPRAARALALGEPFVRAADAYRRIAEAARTVPEGASPGRVDEIMEKMGPAEVLAAWCLMGPGQRAAVERWWRAARGLRLSITGDDLIKAGIPAGPAIGAGLRAARTAALDGVAPDRQSQLEAALQAARRWLEGHG